jgi:hypothetical protein
MVPARSAGRASSANGRPMASLADRPYMRSAPPFQAVTTPSRVLAMIASLDCSATAASRSLCRATVAEACSSRW